MNVTSDANTTSPPDATAGGVRFNTFLFMRAVRQGGYLAVLTELQAKVLFSLVSQSDYGTGEVIVGAEALAAELMRENVAETPEEVKRRDNAKHSLVTRIRKALHAIEGVGLMKTIHPGGGHGRAARRVLTMPRTSTPSVPVNNEVTGTNGVPVNGYDPHQKPVRSTSGTGTGNLPLSTYQQIQHKNDGGRTPAPGRELTDHWVGAWRRRYGRPYPFRRVDGVKAAELLKACRGSVEDAKAVMDRYLACDDAFLNGHSLALLLSGSQLTKFFAPAAPRNGYRSGANGRYVTPAERGEYVSSVPARTRSLDEEVVTSHE